MVELLYQNLTPIADFLLPYEFSPTILAVCLLTGWLHYRGLRQLGRKASWDTLLFWIGLVSIYIVLQTQVDYYGRFSFFIHRTQHLVLHHLGPFLIAVSTPAPLLEAGLPRAIRHYLVDPLVRSPLIRAPFRVIQQPFVAGFLFVAIIYFWLVPSIHFYAMLSIPLYNAMNWGMVIDGLLFWWMIFNLRQPGEPDARHYGVRLLVLFLVMFPQIMLGAFIALSPTDLYSIYALCGRVLPLSVLQEQVLGGLVTWIPAAMMSVAGALVLLVRWTRVTRTSETAFINSFHGSRQGANPLGDSSRIT
ncbi:MAG: cytochrome c oxidase assembly protein [Halothiobacillus sp.]